MVKLFLVMALVKLKIAGERNSFVKSKYCSLGQGLRELFHISAGAVLLLAGTLTAATGQHLPGTNDTSFNKIDVLREPLGFNSHGYAYGSIILPNNKIIVRGLFSSYNGVNRQTIFRLNADGTMDESFDAGNIFEKINWIVVQPDGKLLIGGHLYQVPTYNDDMIVRLHPDGSLDNSFNISNINVRGARFILLPDGKLLVGVKEEGKIFRVHADGNIDNTFNTSAKLVGAFTVQTDGKILMVVDFPAFNNFFRTGIIRLNADGSIDESFKTRGFGHGNIGTIVELSDGKLLVGGSFLTYDEEQRVAIARFNADGSLDTSFIAGTPFHTQFGDAGRFHPQDNGKLLIQSSNGIMLLNPNGKQDESFQVRRKGYLLAQQPDGKLILGDDKVYRINTDGSTDLSFNPGTGFNSTVQVIARQNDGKLIVGGKFITYNNKTRSGLARLNIDGSLDNTFKSGSGFNGAVQAIAIQPNGKVVVGGYFTSFDNTNCNYVTRLNTDGTLDQTFNSGTGFNDSVSSIVLQPDGKLIVGGSFSSYNGAARNRIARLNASGSLDNSFDPGKGFNSTVQAIALQTDGDVVVGGKFTTFNGINRSFIARLKTDGSLDDYFDTGFGFDKNVTCLAIQPDGKVIGGGDFAFYRGVSRNGVVRLNADGTLDDTYNPEVPFNYFIRAIALQSNGKLVLGWIPSHFTAARKSFGRLNADGSQDASFNPGGAGFSSTVHAILLQSDGTMMVGGDFTAYNGVTRNRIARLHNDGLPLSTARELQPKLEVLLYPNPTQGDINLQFSGAEALVGAAELKLYNVLGREVLIWEVSAAEVQAGIKLTTTGLAGGIYFLTISTRNGKVTKRVVLAE